MKKILTVFVWLTLSVLAVLGGKTARAASFDSIDQKTAFGGASLALKRFFESNPDAAERLMKTLKPIKEHADEYRNENGSDAPEEDIETIYEKRVIGVVAVEAALNVRASSTMLSEVVAQEFRGMEIWVIGERLTNSALWYKVAIGETEGYIMGKYVVFGEEAEAFKQMYHEESRDNTPLPEKVKTADDIETLPDDVRQKFDEYAQQANYVLQGDFKREQEAGSYLGMYTVLVYALENYRYLSDICDQYGLSDTSTIIRQQIWAVELNRERLSHESDTSYDEFNKQMAEEAERKAREAREAAEREEKRKREEAEAEKKAYESSLTYQIPNYAAQFINIVPYVWGGASLQYGADCSGFCGQVYAHFGLIDQAGANVHAYDSTTLRSMGRPVSLENILPGDMVCYNGHVAIYYGNGVIVHAPNPGQYVSFGTMDPARVIAVRRMY